MKRRLTRDAFKLHTITICMLIHKACSKDCRRCQIAIDQHKKLKAEDEKEASFNRGKRNLR